ncbi:MAG: serine/threonine-protein kinase [Mycobacteriales bacterium]
MDGIADYTFVRSLGQGNNGEFFLARTPARLPVEAEYVAVKVLVGSTTQQTVRRATRELQAFAGVTSPYLVTLFDAGQDRGTFYYAMEYHPAGSLAAPARPLSRAETLAAVADAAEAAHALHEAGLVHRDIRPGNILLSPTGARLSDLGLAQVFSRTGAVTAMAPIGSVEYVDPLLFRGLQASRATDIWSLGVSLHRVLAGAGIYGDLPEHDPLLALHQVMSTVPQILPIVGADAAAVIAACLHPDPVHRPATAREVADALRSLSAG